MSERSSDDNANCVKITQNVSTIGFMQIASPRWKFCPEDGQKLEADWIVCPKCGQIIGVGGGAARLTWTVPNLSSAAPPYASTLTHMETPQCQFTIEDGGKLVPVGEREQS